MKSLENLDLSGGSKDYLENHLRSDDFFDVDQYPNAILDILSSKKIAENKLSVQGDLTIKGISNPTSFILEFNDNGASAELIFDRSKYNVKFRSSSFFDELGDKLIYDDIELKVDLVFN
jgi:polyisoprenoid-binding protein YceI